MAQALVDRQPILDKILDVFDCELLFHPEHTGNRPINGESATSRVVNNAFADIGLNRIVGEHRAFINVTRNFLLEHHELSFPKDRVVLENVEIDNALIDAVDKFSNSGYLIALDDFIYDPRWIPVLGFADIVKVDIRMYSQSQLAEQLDYLSPTNPNYWPRK